MKDRPQLRRLADRAGILPSYVDVAGVRRVANDKTRVALLAAMGWDASAEATAARSLESLERVDHDRLIAPVRVVRRRSKGRPRVRLVVPGNDFTSVEWHLELQEENGQVHVSHGRAGPRAPDHTIGVLPPADLPAGYHRLRVAVDGPGGVAEAEQTLIVPPSRCVSPAELVGHRQVFGLWANLYTVLSHRGWGFGDLTDLGTLARVSATQGAEFVGINPLHALYNRGSRIAPYCPVSRLYRNFLYLDVEAVPEFAECPEATARFQSPEFQTELSRLRSTTHVDYEGVAAIKTEVLHLLHNTFAKRHADGGTARGQRYAEYIATEGEPLADYATFLVLERVLNQAGKDAQDLRDWPAEYRRPDSPLVETFRKAHRREVDFYCYIQFETDRQLAAAEEEARAAGMRIGLYQDLALGSSADGSDAWVFSDLFVPGVEVGAPPDPYSEIGQTWGFPPMDPRRLTESRYEYWIRVLRSSLAHSGMLRIDHVLGLFRQYWVPEGFRATDGAYVRYPAEDLLGIVALESRRHGAVIVGEDLGTVPRGLPATLARWGVLSSRVLYFQRSRRGSFHPAASYSRRALVTATTHDHPPLAGFWSGRDLEIRHDLGLIRSTAELEDARAERARTRVALLRRLRAEGLPLDPKADSPQALCRAAHTFLARTPSPFVGVSLDDLSGETEPVNVPGATIAQYPCWSRRMRQTVEDALLDPVVRHTLADVRRALDDNCSARTTEPLDEGTVGRSGGSGECL